ncbi:MAG: discoidin domain-containing protein [Acidobacteriia bacterium]|nr:discoidin domain-containing protein [Terriglobia bacterium]
MDHTNQMPAAETPPPAIRFPKPVKQAWTIAKIELRRAFFSKRAFWVYGLALFPAVIFFGHGIEVKIRRDRLSARGLTPPALIDSVTKGESAEEVLKRLGRPASEYQWQSRKRVRAQGETTAVTTHMIEPAAEARFVRLNITRPTYGGDPTARIYEFEVYGPDGPANLALRRPAIGSSPCTSDEGPEKAFNGSVSLGKDDKWCSHEWDRFLQVDLGAAVKVKRFVIKHASAGGESEEFDTREFNIQVSKDGRLFTTVLTSTGAKFVDERTSHRMLIYFDGRREARLEFAYNKLASSDLGPLLNFEEDRQVFAGVFQFFYLRLAIFFGCLGIFMNLFRGEMLDKTLHYWFLAPARREVLLAGKYGAGLIASSVIFAGGALLCFAVMLWTQNPVEAQAYWQGAGMAHAFWYTAAAVLGCVGYGSVFLAAGLLLRNPIIPAAVLLAWESINGFLPQILQKLSVLYYLQSLCPVPAPTDKSAPALIQLLLSPAAPASHFGAILGLLVVTALVLWVARIAVRRMQVSYGAET